MTLLDKLPATNQSSKNAFELARKIAQERASAPAQAPQLESISHKGISGEVTLAICKMVVANWTLGDISVEILKRYNTVVPPNTVAEIAEQIPEAQRLPPSYLVETQSRASFTIDVHMQMNAVLRLMEERLGAASFLEVLGGRPNEATTRLASEYFRMLLSTAKYRDSSSMIPAGGQNATPVHTLPTLGRLIEGPRDPEAQ